MANSRIETLIGKGEWQSAQNTIVKQLAREGHDHWLWSRLSGVKYEQRDYQGALDAAEKALQIVSDCPLALWSYAGALDMLGRTKEAGKIYLRLFRRGHEQLTKPDADAEECWEDADWTRGLVMDCVFRIAGCLVKIGEKDRAVRWYGHFLDLVDYGIQGIYSRADALARLSKLVPNKKSIPSGMQGAMKELEEVMS